MADELKESTAGAVKAAAETKAAGAKAGGSPAGTGGASPAGAAKVRAAFFSDSWVGGAMWFAAVLAMIAVLLWFFFFSDFGTPAEPIYEGF